MIRNTLTGKQRRFLRAMGVQLEPVVFVGREGINPSLAESAREALKKRELIKVRVLQNSPLSADEAIRMLTERVDADLVQIIGHNGLLFKRNFEKPRIELP